MLLFRLFLTSVATNVKLTSIFLQLFCAVDSCSLLHSVVKHDNYLNIEISQGSVATHLRCGKMFNNTKLLVSPPVKVLKIGQHLVTLRAKD